MTSRFSLLMCLACCFPAPSLRAAEPIDAEIQAALARSVGFLETDMRAWRETRKCGACHHAPPALATLREVNRVGVEIDHAAYAELRTWSLTNDRARLIPKPPASAAEQPELSLQAIYLAGALAGDNQPDEPLEFARKQIAEHLRAAQQADGSWRGPVGHPPVFASPTEVTLLAVLAIRTTPAMQSSLGPAIERAEAWLRQQPLSDSTQELALRVMWEVQAHPTGDGKVWTERLMSGQQPDGGWRQTPELSSDAFATGQALVALSAAGISPDDPLLRRAAQFLVSTQHADGTWTMISRPDPKDGQPAENLNPIIYAGTAWAARGLATLVKPAR